MSLFHLFRNNILSFFLLVFNDIFFMKGEQLFVGNKQNPAKTIFKDMILVNHPYFPEFIKAWFSFDEFEKFDYVVVARFDIEFLSCDCVDKSVCVELRLSLLPHLWQRDDGIESSYPHKLRLMFSDIQS